jgi:predicted PurR-regulated permease PerM
MAASQVSLRTVYTVCFGVLSVIALVYAALSTQLAITLSLLAILLAVALHHVVALLMNRGLPHWLAVLVLGVSIAALGTLFSIVVIVPAVSQGQALAKSLPDLVEKVRHTHVFQEIEARVGHIDVTERIASEAPSLLLAALSAVVNIIAAGVTIVLLAIFMLIFGPRMVKRILAEFDDEPREQLERLLANIYRALGGYVAGMVLIAALNMTFTATFLGIIGMPFFLTLAVVSGISSMVPYVGQIVVAVAVSALALATGGAWTAVGVGIYFITYGQIEGNIFGPLIFRRTLHMNPLIVLLAILFLGELSGIVGAFMAIPLAATVQIVIIEVLAQRKHRLAGLHKVTT